MIKKIIEKVILAQIASDAGKGIYDLVDTSSKVIGKEVKRAVRQGYDVKVKYILDAIKLVNATPKCGVNYYVINTPDQNGHDSDLVYFDIRLNGMRYQVSFHSPVGSFAPYYNKGRKTHWDEKSSRKACLAMLKTL